MKQFTMILLVFGFAKAINAAAQFMRDSHSSQKSVVACQSKARLLNNSMTKRTTTASTGNSAISKSLLFSEINAALGKRLFW
jgi:hypothetical protein